MEGIRVVAQKSGSRIFIYCFFSGLGGESVDLEIRVPRMLNLAIWGANPEINLRGIEGFVRAQNFTGVITAEDLASSVSLISDSGDISYRTSAQPRGDARLETSSGNIFCDLPDSVNEHVFLRAGRSITWHKDPEAPGPSLEKLLGVQGPLLYAGSLKGNVSVSLKGTTALAKPAGSESRQTQADANANPENRSVHSQPGTLPVEGDAAQRRATTQGQQAGIVAGGYSLKVSVDSVFLNVSVRDRVTNRSIPDLGMDDFAIYEDGVVQHIEQLATNDAPFNLLLLLDISGSTRFFLPLMKQASSDFTRQIKPNDRIAVAAFNSQVELMQDFTNDRVDAIRAIGRLSSSGGTAFYDALLTCIDDYMRGVEGRSAIVVFTDGVDNQLEGQNSEGSRTPYSQLYRRIQEIDPILYTIFLDTEAQNPAIHNTGGGLGGILGGVLGGGYPGPSPRPGRSSRRNNAIYNEARQQLLDIAEQTGGRIYSPNRIEDLSRVYGEIAEDLRIQYQLGYNSTNRSRDGKWREIRVAVKGHPNAVVRTRRGYLARMEKD
jgi:VWFA-related protein